MNLKSNGALLREALAHIDVQQRDEFLNRLADLLLQKPIDVQEAVAVLRREQVAVADRESIRFVLRSCGA